MDTAPWLSLTIAVLAVGSIAVSLLPRSRPELAKVATLGISLLAFDEPLVGSKTCTRSRVSTSGTPAATRSIEG